MKMLCDICRIEGLVSIGQVQGYRQGSQFRVLECTACGTSVVDPCRADERLYDAIYENVSKVPGYSRYHALAGDLLRVRNPLKYIAGTEDSYYAIVKALEERAPDKSRTKICEVGCGQGYLTYSLVRAGYDCTGVDISANAVALAKQRYGDHYFCGTVNDFGKLHAKPDVVIATELIEHLEDPVQFLLTLLRALGEGGIIVLTTPNKPPHSLRIWDTELPPVHLWWFTKSGLAAIAKQVECGITFVDFTDFYKATPGYRLVDRDASTDRMPVFDEHYELMQSDAVNHRLGLARRRMKRAVPNYIIRKIQQLRAGDRYGGIVDDANSSSIGAILTKPRRS